MLDRQRDRGEAPEFVQVRDGRYRLDVPVDAFAAHDDPAPSDHAIETLIARLAASALRKAALQPGDGPNIGAPFERDVADAFAALGLRAERLGGEGQPDVVATAPLGDRAYTVVVECKTVAGADDVVKNPVAQEAGRLRDAVRGDFAVLLGPAFPHSDEIDGELSTHRVALWTVGDLAILLRAHATHAIRWSRLVPLFAPGRASAAITFIDPSGYESQRGWYDTPTGLPILHESPHDARVTANVIGQIRSFVFDMIMNTIAMADGDGEMALSMRASTSAGLSAATALSRRTGKPPEIGAGAFHASDAMHAVETYLGGGSKLVSQGRYVSKDGMRQVRWGLHETSNAQNQHIHFETYDHSYWKGGKVSETATATILTDVGKVQP